MARPARFSAPRSHTDAERAWNLRVRHNPEVGAHVMAAIDQIRDRLFRAARAQGRREASEADAADALVELAHLGRRANAPQQTALEWLYPTCAVEGCSAGT